MAIVKIFPEDQNRSDFSIRLIAEKYHVYEGDKLLRTNLLNIADAVKEIDFIIDERLKNKLTSVKVSHQGFEAEDKMVSRYKRKHTITPMPCKNCGKDFNSIRSNHLTCSRECSSVYSRYLKTKNESVISMETLVDTTTTDFLKKMDVRLPKEYEKDFEDPTRKLHSDKKREHFFKDFISIMIGSRVYSAEMERKWDFDDWYKNMLRLNLVFYNNVNIFTLMPTFFRLEKDTKITPFEYSVWMSEANQKLVLSNVLEFMEEMHTYPTNQQQNAFSSFAILKVVFDDVVTLKNNTEILLAKMQKMNKTLVDLEKFQMLQTLEKNAMIGGKKINEIDPLNREEPIIRDYIKDDFKAKNDKKRKWFNF